MTKDKAMKLALEALKDMNCGWRYIRESHGDLYGVGWDRSQEKADDAIEALRQAIEQAESKTAADCDSPSWCNQYGRCHRSVVCAPILANCMEGQEPIGYFSVNKYGNWEQNENDTGTPFYEAPPKREWQGLTQEDIDIAFDDTQEGGGFDDFARAIEAKLKEKNHVS